MARLRELRVHPFLQVYLSSSLLNSDSLPQSEQLQQFEKTQGQLSSALSRLLVTVERYPELKANANFRDLQAQLEGTENRIAVERQKFNEAVRSYNTAIRQFPASFVARFGRFNSKPYFQAPAGSETPPNVKFDFGAPATNK